MIPCLGKEEVLRARIPLGIISCIDRDCVVGFEVQRISLACVTLAISGLFKGHVIVSTVELSELLLSSKLPRYRAVQTLP